MINNKEKYKIATSIWILSCTDKIPRLLYQSLPKRLEVDDIQEFKDIVNDFPELFRLKIQEKHLRQWKTEMLNKKSRPKWIAKASNQEEIINNLTTEDTFINRFRNSYDSPAVNHDILKWGLEYLKEFYTKIEKETDKKWNRFSNIALPLISLLIAGASVFYSYESNKSKQELEQLNTRRDLIIPSYHKFLNNLTKSYNSSGTNRNLDTLLNNLSNSRTAIFEIRPFLIDSVFEKIDKDFVDYQLMVMDLQKKDSISDKNIDDFINQFHHLNNKVSEEIVKAIDYEK